MTEVITRTVLCAIVLAAGAVAPRGGVAAQSPSPTHPPRQGAPGVPQPPRKPRLFSPQDLGLLEAPDRDLWNNPDLIMDALGIADGATVADLGAGGGWFTLRLARRVGPNGIVYAEDIQPQMIEAINRRMKHEGIVQVRTVLGTATDPRLPDGLDAVLIMNAYREMDDPARPDVVLTLLGNVARSLKPQGRLGVVDFLPGGGGPGPAAEDRINPDTVVRAAEAAGLTLLARETVQPFQFLLVFGKAAARQAD
jgi:ubiquinone/menaquinone biosynthesis C-methylase UbiE